LRIDNAVWPALKLTAALKREREAVRLSLARFHQEVSDAGDAHEAVLYSFNDMEDMAEEVLKRVRIWDEYAAAWLRSLQNPR
jgi:hypothetical protein